MARKGKNPFADLTKLEWGLWLLSISVITSCSLFSHDNNILSIIASLIGVTALIFVAKGYVFGQILTVVFAVFYGIISLYFRYYGEMITYVFMTAPMAIFSILSWLRHPYKGSKEVEVHHLKRKQITGLVVATIAVTILFYFILSALNNANLLISTLSITTSFLASALTFYRSPYYALAYAANDVVLIVLWILAALEQFSYFPMVICFVMFLLNDIYGYYNWQRMRRRQSEG